MGGFLDYFSDTRSMQTITCVVACTLAFILLLIKLPTSEYTKKLSNAKTAIAISFLVCGFMMIFSIVQYSKVSDYEVFATITMLVTVSLSSLAISYAMITILNEQMLHTNLLAANMFVVFCASLILIESCLNGRRSAFACLIVNLVIFAAECVYLIILFDKAYKQSLKDLNAYYDEDENHKIRWIRFCYIIAMLTNMFFLVYMVMPHKFMKLYMAWYIIFMLYFAANFISFIGSHKIVLDAFAHNALALGARFAQNHPKQKKEEPVIDARQRDREFKRIAVNIDKWVGENKFREYDKSREEIASELGTTKEMLQLYFANVVGKDFRTWRTELRINDAKKLLLEDRKSSAQFVGEFCGFSDRSNFHTTFIKFVGCTPKQWREKNENV